jgi:hypothetical protein
VALLQSVTFVGLLFNSDLGDEKTVRQDFAIAAANSIVSFSGKASAADLGPMTRERERRVSE